MALVFWAEDDGHRRYVVEKWVTADQVAKIPGEDYRHIPVLHAPLDD